MYFRVKLPVCHSITSFLWFSFSFQHLSKALSVSKLLILKLTMSVKWVLCVAHQQAGNQRKKSFFKRTLPFGSALQTLLKEFKFQALLLSALILAQILTLQQSYNLRVAHPHEKVLKADNFALLPLAISIQFHFCTRSRLWLYSKFIPNPKARALARCWSIISALAQATRLLGRKTLSSPPLHLEDPVQWGPSSCVLQKQP